MIILGNLFSLLASIISVISTRAKTYQKTLLIQTLDSILFTLSCICLHGYSGIVINICGAIKNLSCALFNIKTPIKIVFIILTVVFGVLFMDKSLYGVLPIIASTYYSTVMFQTKNVNKLKFALLINNILWLIYEIIILDFIGVIFKIISIISCIQIQLTNKKRIYSWI